MVLLDVISEVDRLRANTLCFTLTKPKFARLRAKMDRELGRAETKLKRLLSNYQKVEMEFSVVATRPQSYEDNLFCMDGAFDRFLMINKINMDVINDPNGIFTRLKNALTNMQAKVDPGILEFIDTARGIHGLKRLSTYRAEAEIYLLNLRIEGLTNTLNNASRIGERTTFRDNVLRLLCARLTARQSDYKPPNRITTTKKIRYQEGRYDKTYDQTEFEVLLAGIRLTVLQNSGLQPAPIGIVSSDISGPRQQAIQNPGALGPPVSDGIRASAPSVPNRIEFYK